MVELSVGKYAGNFMSRTCVCPIPWGGIVGVQRKIGVARDREVVHRKSIQHFGCLDLCWNSFGCTDLGQTIGHKENEHDEQTIRWSLDLKVAEKRVCSKEIQRFVNDIGLFEIS